MIWGGISLNQLVGPVVFQNIGPGRDNGVTAQRYIDQVLRTVTVVVPHLQQHRNMTLQQDNALPYTARVTTHFLRQQGIKVQQWSSLSSDINPIEHFRDHVQRELKAFHPMPTAAHQLEQAIRQIWRNVQMAMIHFLPRRCQALIDARAGHTPY